jgi:hypothetical protein
VASGRSALRMVPVVPAWVGVAQRSVAVVDSRHAARKVGRERTGSWVTMRVETCANLVSVRSREISSVVVEGDTWSRVACVVHVNEGYGKVSRSRSRSLGASEELIRDEMGTGIDASLVALGGS